MKKNIIGSQFKLGILGGGQLGRMFIQEAISYNIHVHIMESDESAPCFGLASSFTKGDITNYHDVINFGADLDVLTVEIENVNIEALYELEKRGILVYPQPRVLEIIKDKGLQKEFYSENLIPTAPFKLIDKNPDLSSLRSSLPFVQKLRTGGYDGRGVEVMRLEEDLDKAFDAPTIIEELIPFTKELSVIVARNRDGETAVYPTVECEFNEVNLVEYLFSPADIEMDAEQKATKLALSIIEKLDMVGILAVELFLTEDGRLLVNEIAPRPHNSGHHTIECNTTSQFEQHLRSVLNMPLGSTKMTQCGAMLNLLGEPGFSGKAIYKGLENVLQQPGVHIHLYGKEITKSNRKMGHLTISGSSIEVVKSIVEKVKGKIQIVA